MRKIIFPPFLIFLLLIANPLKTYSKSKVDYMTLSTENKIITDICFTAGGSMLFVSDGLNIKAFDPVSGKVLKVYSGGHTERILSIDVSADSSIIVSAGKDGLVLVWNLAEGTVISRLKPADAVITAVKISDDGTMLAAGAANGSVSVFDIATGRMLYTFTDQVKEITTIAFKSDNRTLAAAGADGFIRLYDLQQGKQALSFRAHRGWVRELKFSKDGTALVSCGDDSMVVLRGTRNFSGDKNIIYKGLLNWITCADIYKDNQTIAFGSINGALYIKTPLKTYKTELGVPVSRVCFLPGHGAYIFLAVATRTKGVILIDSRKMDS